MSLIHLLDFYPLLTQLWAVKKNTPDFWSVLNSSFWPRLRLFVEPFSNIDIWNQNLFFLRLLSQMCQIFSLLSLSIVWFKALTHLKAHRRTHAHANAHSDIRFLVIPLSHTHWQRGRLSLYCFLSLSLTHTHLPVSILLNDFEERPFLSWKKIVLGVAVLLKRLKCQDPSGLSSAVKFVLGREWSKSFFPSRLFCPNLINRLKRSKSKLSIFSFRQMLLLLLPLLPLLPLLLLRWKRIFWK